MNRFSFGRQIIISFSAIALAFIVASYIVNHHTHELATNIERVNELRLPTAQASKNLSSGVSKSLAALRGWLILEDPQFTIEREEAWIGDIIPALVTLSELSKNWTNAENITRLEAIRSEIELFKRAQEEISSIAHTLESAPATKILIEDAKPLADTILQNITAMIELSSQRTLTKKEQSLFKNMADFRGSFAQLLASIRLFLIAADPAARLDFVKHWHDNEDAFTRMIALSSIMTAEQTLIFKNLSLKRNTFSTHPKRMFAIRMSSSHNKAHHLLKSKAAPSAKIILSILDDMVINQRSLLDKEVHQHSEKIETLNKQIIISIFLGLTLTIILGYFTVKSFGRMSTDINQQAKKLNDNAATNKGILDTSKDAIVSISTSGKILYCNQTTSKMFGYNQEELIGNNIKMLMPEQFSRQHDGYLAEHMRTRIKKDIWGGSRELIAKNKDGRTFPIFLSIGSVNTNNEQIFTGFIRDITDQTEAKNELELVNKNLTLQNFKQDKITKINEVMRGESDIHLLGNNILTSLADLLKASHGVLYSYNKGDKEDKEDKEDKGYLRIVSTYAHNKPIQSSQRFHLGDGLVGQCAMNQSTLHVKNIPTDYPSISSGIGESQPVEILLFPILFENKLLGVIELATFTPITEEQKETIDIARLDIGIVFNNVTNIEKTNLLLKKMQQQSDELQQQSKILAQSNEYKSDFLATMSHEIRTPMNGILGMLGMLVKSDLSKDQMKKASMARSSAQSLLTIINDILDFSKVDAGKLELEMLDFDLRGLFEELSELMSIKAYEKNLDFNLDIVNIKHTMVKGDASRIRQILTNLIGNAIKFTHQGDITIVGELEALGPNKLKFTCAVEDTGIGITKDKQDQLFEAFRQADASTTREYGGTGLGLSISKKLCELMGGTISVSNRDNGGSRFGFTLELEQSAQSERLSSPLEDLQLRILVTDNQVSGRNIIYRQLKTWGAHVSKSENGATTLSMLNNCANGEHYHMAFITNEFSDMDIQTFSKQYDNSLPTKIVLINSNNTDQQHQTDTNLVACRILRKPTTPSDMFDALSALPEFRERYARTIEPTQSGSETNSDPGHSCEWTENPRILLVEDNFINQEMMTFMMEDIGLIPDIASDGQQAIDMLNDAGDRVYSLVLMDCQMPILDGYDATKRIRNGENCKGYESIPIIALTANAMDSDRERCLSAGMTDYLSKPINPDLFTVMMKKWLS